MRLLGLVEASVEPRARALELLRRARREYGDDDISTTITMRNLAHLLMALGELDESRTLLDEAYTKETGLPGADHPQTLATGRALHELTAPNAPPAR